MTHLHVALPPLFVYLHKQDLKEKRSYIANINVAILQPLQHTTVVEVDQSTEMQNSQNTNYKTIINILCNFIMVEYEQNSNSSYKYSIISSFETTGLALLNCTSSATKNNGIVQCQLLIMV